MTSYEASTVPKPLYTGTYPRRAKAIRDAAWANPLTRCWRCKRTYPEAVRLWGKSGAAWQAGHLVDGHAGSPLVAEHARCNTAAGGRLGRARQAVERASPNG
jgi:hypothetical protein